MEKNPLDPFRTDVEWKERLEWFRMDIPVIRKRVVVTQKKPQPLIPLASGVLSMALGIGILVSPAFAERREPLLEVPVGKEPNKPMIRQENSVLPKKRIEPQIQIGLGEPKHERKSKNPKHQAAPQPAPEPIPAPMLELPKMEEPKAKPPEVTSDQPSSRGRTEFSVPLKPLDEAVSRPRNLTQKDSAPSLKPSHLSLEDEEPMILASESPSISQSSKEKQSNQLAQKDSTPIQKTENGGELPKTAGHSANFVLGGSLLLLGGYQLRLPRRMRDV